MTRRLRVEAVPIAAITRYQVAEAGVRSILNCARARFRKGFPSFVHMGMASANFAIWY
jgi:hypothetical protein